MPPWPPHLYRRAGRDAGRPPELVERALAQASAVQSAADLPAVLTLNHLATEVGVSYRTLRAVVSRSLTHPYRLFQVTKRSGGHRQICVPIPPLLAAQRWVARHVLAPVRPHPASFAYAPGRSPVECARMHCGCRWLIKVDVQQFFESISERQVYRVFRGLGYQPLVAFELTRLCTRVGALAGGRYRQRRWRNWTTEGRYSITGYRSTRVGHLPQGAPTSPMLSNLVARGLDERLSAHAAASGLLYTRYADDLIFSTGNAGFDRTHATALVRCVYDELRVSGLRPRTAKTVVSPPGARKVVLGLLVDRERPRLTREFRERLELHVYYLVKRGPVSHLEQRGFRSIGGMREHICGLLTYANHIEPDFVAPLLVDFQSVEWPE